jgi:hypothetical protein
VRPDAPLVIRAALATLDELAAGRGDQGDLVRLHSVATLLRVLGDEWDDGAAVRVAAIHRYRLIFTRARALVGDNLAGRLGRLIDAVDISALDLRISALDRTLDELRESVIELQIALEASEGTDERAVLAELWRVAYDDAAMDDRHRAFW